MLTKVRTLIHEEISLLTVLYFPFRARTPMTIHEIDLFRWLTGEEPVEVYATGSSFIYPELSNGPDTAVVTLKSSSGVIGVINNVLRSSFGYDQRLEVQGERGMLQVQNRESSKLVISDRSGVRSGGPQNSFIERFAEAYRTELNLFLSNLWSGKPMQPDGLDGLRASLIAECVEQAYRTSVSVPVLNDFSSLSQTASSTGEMVNIDNTVGCRFAVSYSINNSAIRLTPFTSNEPS